MLSEKKLYDLIEACKENNRAAQHDIYTLFSKKLFVICLRYAVDYNEAEDMLQEGFIKLFNKIEKYNHSGSFAAWSSRVITNNCIDLLRKKPNLYAITDAQNNTIESYDLNALDQLVAEDLMHLIQSLPTGYRTIFNMYLIDGYAHNEIAEKLNINIGTSKSQLNRARKLLLKKLEDIKTYESLKISR